MTFNEAWEREAEHWIAWARAANHDAYWWYAPAFFDELVPDAAGRTLEIGCGEGRSTRDLSSRGHDVVAIDASPTLLSAARHADPGGEYHLADAAALSFPDGSFALVVAYNSLMDIQDMPGAVREAARVLSPEGRFCVSITHPLMDAGRWDGAQPDAPFVIDGTYFGRRPFEGTFSRGEMTMTFHGWCYPLELYTRAFEDAGLLIETIREPSNPAEDPRHARVPPFLWLKAVRPGRRSS